MNRIRADLQNHFSTKSIVLDVNRVADTVRERLGPGGLCGLVNYEDRRYEAFAERAERVVPSSKNLGNAVYFPDRDVMIIKGEEINTRSGDLLVLGLYEGILPKHGDSLSMSIIGSYDLGGINIVTTPYFMSKVGREIENNPALLKKIHAIEIYNGITSKKANEKARRLYNEMRDNKSGRHLGFLVSSDGHSFFEVGNCWTELEMKDYNELSGHEDVQRELKKAISKNTRDYLVTDGRAAELDIDIGYRTRHSILGFALHAGILAAMIMAGKIGIQVSRGDKGALLQETNK